jgi:pimeloyl-ACP methyl ester carboxylesterase
MDKHQLEKANLMGHSMGGKVVMFLAVQEPARVDSMIIIDIAPQAYALSGASSQTLTHTRILEAMLAVDFNHVQSREDVNNQLARTIYSHRIRRFLLKNLERTRHGQYRWMINANVIKTELQQVLDGLDPSAFMGGRGITGFQALFIRGEESDYITDDMIPGIQTIFPMAEITTIPGAGHWLHVEQASALIKTVKYFLLGE